MSIELVSLHSRIWNLSRIQVCNNDPNDDSLENVADWRLPSGNLLPEDGKDASPETIAAPISYPVNADNDYSPTAAEPHPTSQNVEHCESLDMEGDKGFGKHNAVEQNGVKITSKLSSDRDSEMAKSSETPLLTDNGFNEVHEMNVEITTFMSRVSPMVMWRLMFQKTSICLM